MSKETFTERFNRLTADIKPTRLAMILGISEAGLRKLRVGDTQSLKLTSALRLARELGVSPWYLACEPEPTAQPAEGATETIAQRFDAIEERLVRIEEALRPRKRAS